MRLLKGIALASGLAALALSGNAWSLGNLENPAPGSTLGGIGVFSGWHCSAGTVEIQVDDLEPKLAAYGTSRKDTLEVCGQEYTGFSLLWNFNYLGDGQHTVRVLADGVEFDRAEFTVQTLEGNFVEDIQGATLVTLPQLGLTAGLVWQQSLQNFTIVDTAPLRPDIADAYQGNWSGSWLAEGFIQGSMYLVLDASGLADDGVIVPTDLMLDATGCATSAFELSNITSLDFPVTRAVMTDLSEVDLRLMPAPDYSFLAGTFEFTSGICGGFAGSFTLFR
jgi:hypothetical protein